MVVKTLFILGIAFVLLFTYSLCRAVGDYDKFIERTKGMSEAERWQTAYNEYRRKFAHDRKITVEQATEYQAVKNYKAFLEAEHGVVIMERGAQNECC